MSITSPLKFPLRMMWIVPKRPNLYAFEIIIPNKPEAHQLVHSKFSSFGGDIVYEFHSGISDDRSVIFVAALFTGEDVKPNDLIESLRSETELIIDARLAGESSNFYYADMLFPIYLSDSRAIIFDNASLKGMLKQFRVNFGEDGASALLFHMGQAIGESIYTNHIAPRGYTSKNIGDLLDNLHPILHSLGWGHIRKMELDRKKISIHVLDYWECSILREAGFRRSTGQIFRGILTKIMERIHGKRVFVAETRCISKGAEECVFEVSPIEGLFNL